MASYHPPLSLLQNENDHKDFCTALSAKLDTWLELNKEAVKALADDMSLWSEETPSPEAFAKVKKERVEQLQRFGLEVGEIISKQQLMWVSSRGEGKEAQVPPPIVSVTCRC